MTMFRYLSPEWHEAAEPIRRRFAETHPSPEVPLVANVTVTGVPFGDGTAEMHSAPGVPNVLDPGHVEHAEVHITIGYRLARLVLLDESTDLLQLAFRGGEIAVDGNSDRLAQYWRSHIGDAAYLEMLEALRAITK